MKLCAWIPVITLAVLLGAWDVRPMDDRRLQYFTDCTTETTANATIIIPEGAYLAIEGQKIQEGDEIAVFSSDSTCVGAVRWSGASLALPIWERDPWLERAGLSPGEEFHFRIWPVSIDSLPRLVPQSDVYFSNEEPHFISDLQYSRNGIYRLDSLVVRSTPTDT